MLIIEVMPGRYLVAPYFRELESGAIVGSHETGPNQNGRFTYRDREHFLSDHHISEEATFTKAEIAEMGANVTGSRLVFQGMRIDRRNDALAATISFNRDVKWLLTESFGRAEFFYPQPGWEEDYYRDVVRAATRKIQEDVERFCE